MLNSSDYAKNYASTIGKSLLWKRMRIYQICQAAKSFRCRAREKRKNVKFVNLIRLKQKGRKKCKICDSC